jgi:hypothetical protein
MRHLIILLVIVASLAVLFGVLAKLQGWVAGDYLIGAGLLTEMAAAVYFIRYLLKQRRERNA